MQASFKLDEKESKIGKPFNVLGMPTYLKVAASDTNGKMSMFYGDYRKHQGPPLHQHDLDEFFYVIEGEFLFQLGPDKIKAGAGTTVFIPRMMPHTFLVLSEVGRVNFVVSPSSDVETLFTQFDSFESMPPIEELIKISDECGCPVLGPPITVD